MTDAVRTAAQALADNLIAEAYSLRRVLSEEALAAPHPALVGLRLALECCTYPNISSHDVARAIRVEIARLEGETS